MRILVIGANGFVGGYVTARLIADGHAVVGLGRETVAAERRFPTVDWVRADIRRLSMQDWTGLVVGIDAIVNCAGALQDGPGDDLRAVHVQMVQDLAGVCESSGVNRFVHVSAAGVEHAGGRFMESKLEAERALKSTTLEWIILRPGLILAPTAYGGSALLRGLAAFPRVVPLVSAGSILQIAAIEDVVEAVARSLHVEPARFVCDVVGSADTSLGDIVLALRSWLGLAPAKVFEAPAWMGIVAAAVADGLTWLGWRSPMRTASIRQLAYGVTGNAGDSETHLGITPRSLSEALARWPSGVQERWFARLYFVKPLLLVTLVGFWAASGVIGFTERNDAQLLLVQSGLSAPTAGALVLGGCAADLIIALLTCFRSTARLGLCGMVVVTLAYLVGASLWLPALWADPFGPLVKAIPAAVLALAALAILDER